MPNLLHHTNQLVDVDPAELVIGLNVRGDARLDSQFVDSIRERGVLEPIVAYRDAEDRLIVLYGQRRTLAAVEAGRPTVPVMVIPEPGDVDRLVDQLVENAHRTGLGTADRVAAFQQLAALGVPAGAIAKKATAPKATVEAALRAATSEVATAAAATHQHLTIEQAAGIAEFDGDPDAVDTLIEAGKLGEVRFGHQLQRLRDDRESAQRLAAKEAELTATGLTLVARPGYGDKKVQALGYLKQNGKALTEAKHRKCPGHAAYLEETWSGSTRTGWAPKFVCTNVPKHGHESMWGTSGALPAAEQTPEQREAARAERRDTIESNKAWDSAQTVRRAWLQQFIARKAAPKGAAVFIAAALTERGGDAVAVSKQHNNNRLARELLGVKACAYGDSVDELHDLAASAPTEARALMIALAVVLAAYEDTISRDAWRQHRPGTARYLRFLQANGYELSDVEERACVKKDGA